MILNILIDSQNLNGLNRIKLSVITNGGYRGIEMKVRVTLMTENDKPVSVLGENSEEKVKIGWELVCTMLNTMSVDSVTLENVEIVE